MGLFNRQKSEFAQVCAVLGGFCICAHQIPPTPLPSFSSGIISGKIPLNGPSFTRKKKIILRSCDCPCKVLYKSSASFFLMCPYSIIRHVCNTTVLCLKRFYNQFIEGRGKWLYECIRIKAIDFKLIFPVITFPWQFSLLLPRLDFQSHAELLSLGWLLALVACIQTLNNNVRR